MKKLVLGLSIVGAATLGSCSVKLATVLDKTPDQIKSTYKVTKDVAYSADKEQVMDIYLANNAKRLKNKTTPLFSCTVAVIISVIRRGKSVTFSPI